MCVRVCKTVWLSYFCKLQWAAGLAAPVFPRGLKGEYWLSCFVIQMPNVPPAKQLPPVTVLNRAALSLSLLFIAVLLASFQSAVSLLSYFSSLFVVVLPPSAHFDLFLQICLDLLSSLTLSFLLLSFAFIAFLYFISHLFLLMLAFIHVL